MKRSLDPFRAVSLLSMEERAESLSCTDTALYVGTALGNLLQYELSWGGGAPEEAAAKARRQAAVKLSPKRPVEQVHALQSVVLALVDGALHMLPNDIGAGSGTLICREARMFCPHTGSESRGAGQQREVCISFRKKLTLYVHNGRLFEPRHEFQSPEAACALAWHQSWICAGFRREYTLYSDRNGVPREVYRLDGKLAAPQMCLAGNDLLLLVQESKGLFLNLSTQQVSPNPVTWPRKVQRLGSSGSYVAGSSGQGQVDVFSTRDRRNCQTLALEGTVLAICGGVGSRMLVATETSVVCLDLVPFELQMQKLLMQVRVSDALDLLNHTFAAEDPQRPKQLSRFHARAGWALFRDMQFLTAFQHFMYCPEFRLMRVLAFWRSHLPAKFDAEAAAGRDSPDDGGPGTADDIRNFICRRLSERHPSEPVEESEISANLDMANAGMITFLLKQREALLAEERIPAKHRTRGISDPGSMLQAVDTVLLKLLIGTDQDDLRLTQLLEGGVRCMIEDCEGLLRERDRIDVLVRLWKDLGMFGPVLHEWITLLNACSGGSQRLTKSQIVSEMCSALKGACSSPGGRDRSRKAESRDLGEAPGQEVATQQPGTGHGEDSESMLTRNIGGAALLRKYVPEVLKVEPSAVLPIFTGPSLPGRPPRCPLEPDEVLQLLQGHDAVMLGYLEHLVLDKRDVEPRYRAQLAQIYIVQVAEEQKGTKDEGIALSPTRQKLLRFLEEAEDLDARDLMPSIQAFGLHEETVVLHSREQQHQEALRILVEVMNDLARAEIYCRVVAARQRPHRGAARPVQGGMAAGGPSVFCAEPPAWARPTVFGPQRAGGDGEDRPTVPKVSPGTRSGEGSEAGHRPLMFFLTVLLEASVGAEQRPEKYRKKAQEYRDAALALLSGYAGHRDLPPSEVIGMLPADWTLQNLAGYLTECARIGLHERRAAMLEKNLSSMAYLKTFSALASERSRKVTISGDKCCPVCNRRFVDKDSVGKAFVAYPNETCVHLQCKEDLSVCPKTGISFTDNLSVYCNALGGMEAETADA